MNLSRPISALLLILAGWGQTAAQSYAIKGRVTDTLNANELQYSSVTLIREADSILETFTRTAENGSFQLHTPHEGKYIIMVSFPGFADYVDLVTVDKNKPVFDIGTIPMVTKTHLLTEFVLKQQVGAIKIKGDTVEYMADSFKVREGATVEELLKKLPGIQVNKNGEVVAQGEKVQKILVDGEEFFTDDPAVVTKSLQSKAVEKVQVFDKKSDQAEFTGIDDGTREKTINLQLKDNMKKGFFGKINAGGGTDGYYENQGMINAFKGKRKVSAFGIISNTGKIGLNWEDRDKFGGSDGSNTQLTDAGEMITYFTGGEDDESWSGTYSGQGLPTAWTGGLHFSNKWHNDDLHFSSNYRYAKQNIETTGNTLTQYNLPSDAKVSQYYSNQQQSSFKTGERNRVDGLFEWKFDTTSSLKLTANAGYSNTITHSADSSLSYDTVRVLNSNSRITTNDATAKTLNASLAYRKKFAKKGRTLSITLDENYKETLSSGTLVSNTTLFPGTDSALNTALNQNKKNNSRNFRINGNASYTEPLSKILFLELNYGLALNNSYARRLSLDPSVPEGDPGYVDSLYSSDYDFNVLSHKGAATLRFVFKKINFSLGGSVSATSFEQRDNFYDKTYSRNYTNFFPKAAFVYRPSQQKTFSINYSGSTQQPSIDQIQPLRQNTDPLNISIGNENLKQEFDHNINIRYNNYKVLTGTYTYMGGGFTIANDDIGRSETIVSGIRTYQYINVDGNYNGWGYGGYGWNLRKLDLRLGFNGNINMGRSITYVNGQRNESNNNTYSLGMDINYDKEKKFNIGYNPRATYNYNTSSVNGSSSNYWSFSNGLEGNVQLPWKMEIGTDVQWTVRQRVAEFDDNNSTFIWNAYVSKKFLKGDQLELRASAFDMLDQNVGHTRYGYNGNLTEQNYNTIRRYGLFSLIWNFTRSAAGAPQEDGGTKIIIKR